MVFWVFVFVWSCGCIPPAAVVNEWCNAHLEFGVDGRSNKRGHSKMASESRLYTFSSETLEGLRKFRLGTSRASKPQGVIYKIDKVTLEIKLEDDEAEVYTSLNEISDGLPEHVPRFVLLSYPVTLNSGRRATPYVLLYYLPLTANNELRMLYAGAKELMRNKAEVGKVLEVADEEEILQVEEILKE
ncbi:unnamed protein product [Tuber melanosporum]|uniref:(Perigord truffle) hypothetical protein n=1 Tax=Tuber melanosporum (strain Mel28) TaxID=656061 RepID=D5G7C6_TUBMM|nr:uncharacterized protein GSTUM_00002442001 [Tuber melanosporum]CAZ80419.1 unnamed protein product [Tuber melanosporum]